MFSVVVRKALVTQLATRAQESGMTRLMRDLFGEQLDTLVSASANDTERAEALVRWAEVEGPKTMSALLTEARTQFPGTAPGVDLALEELKRYAPDIETAVRERRPLGQVFVDREPLKRYVMADLGLETHEYRIVLVRGGENAGKSWFWSFVRYAAGSLHVDAIRIDLEPRADVTARELFDALTSEAAQPPAPPQPNVDPNAQPPQQALSLVSTFVGWAKTRADAGQRPLWILIDHIDKVWPLHPKGGAKDFILHLARAALDRKVAGLRVFLIGLPQDEMPGWLEYDHKPLPVDGLTPEDLVHWMQAELDAAPTDTRLHEAARGVLTGPPRGIHRRLDDALRKLRAQLAAEGGA
jgi:hypothetical protein